MTSTLRKYIRSILSEELGRNLQTIEPDVMDWRDLPGSHVEVSPDPARGGYFVNVKSDDPDIKDEVRYFSDETSANFWARDAAERSYKKHLNKSDKKLQSK
jgi:hypothetical protein